MNEWQGIHQLRYVLRTAIWPSGSKVFGGNVVVTAGIQEEALERLGLPMALIRVGPGDSDPDYDQEPVLFKVHPRIFLACANPGDALGQNAILGAHIVDELKSAGKGLLQVQEVLYDKIKLLTDTTGIRVQCRAKSAPSLTRDQKHRHLAFRDYELEMVVGAERFYHPTIEFAATNLGGGTAQLTWVNGPDRFDRRRVRIRRATGSAAPATITDGVEVTLLGDLTTFHVDSPGAGTFSYSTFMCYDDRADPPATDRQFSAPESKTVVVT